MKKNLLILLLCILLVGCKQTQKEKSVETKTETITENKETKKESKETVTESKEDTKKESKETVAESKKELVAENKKNSNEITIGKTLTLGDYEITIKEYKLVKDYKDNPALKIVYDWKNNSKKTVAPFMTIRLKGFQNGVETDTSPMILDSEVDYRLSQKNVKPGISVEGLHAAIGLENIDTPLELELTELISFNGQKYTTTLKNLSDYE